MAKIIFRFKNHLKFEFFAPKMSYLVHLILAFSNNFCPIKSDLSGKTVWLQASGLQKLAKIHYF